MSTPTPTALPPLSTQASWESLAILRQAAEAHRFLAEFKGLTATIPNADILLSTLSLQEAKDSSEVESIITTHDELFKDEAFPEVGISPAAKEVGSYARALRLGHDCVKQTGLIKVSDILNIHQALENNNAGFRKLPGTDLKNARTGEVIYTPPQHPDQIIALMDNLVRFINDPAFCQVDPLIKMAVMHHQFESIHPFYDGNGRTGRILNILILVQHGLLDLPVLYLSRYVIQTKDEYYRELQQVRRTGDWEPWILYMLRGVARVAKQGIALLAQLRLLMQDTKHRMRETLPNIYSQDLLNNLFRHPYTKIALVERDLGVSRITATRYLELLAKAGFVRKERLGRSNYYINVPLVALFQHLPGLAAEG